ncbi:hypothetical protein B566_EDAN002757 [Ephemera danica]|nr:hypothetical protein B566_EDAN002757 [Ephemera danica]
MAKLVVVLVLLVLIASSGFAQYPKRNRGGIFRPVGAVTAPRRCRSGQYYDSRTDCSYEKRTLI